jgi:DNA polymerase III subunit gamma/tau
MTIKTVQPWATKHRPKRFEDVVGQDDAVARLQGAIKRRSLPNAIMLVGPSGVGKTTLARLFARYVNCKTHDACGKCDSCLALPHPDVEEMNAAEARGIDEVRSLIQRARYKPRYNTRVFVIDEAHQMTPQSLQAFLKPLEEPPPNTMYILCTTDPQRFPNTIINRCLVLDLGLPTVDAVVSRLQRIARREKLEFPAELYTAIAESTNGHVREAINALENAANALASNPKIKTERLLQSVIHTADQDAQRSCMRLMLGLYANKPRLVVKAAFELQDVTPALNQCIWFNEYVMAQTLGLSTRHVFHSPANREFAKQVKDKVPDVTVATLLAVQRRLVALRNELHTVATKEISTLLAHLA